MNNYDAMYADQPGPPWDIGTPQPALTPILDRVRGPKVLDIGCGTGDLAIALARRGHDVTAVDISSVAIETARAKATAEGLTIDFTTQDATHLTLPSAPFNEVFDSGLLHSLVRNGGPGTDAYLAQLPQLAAPGATVYVLAVSLQAGHGWGVTEAFLRTSFAEPQWTGTDIQPAQVVAQDIELTGFLTTTKRTHPIDQIPGR
jgi:ubiquinone/menaquinone biosynthesis C-methylase UbiE